MNTFQTIWSYLQTNLKVGTTIPNWKVFHGYLGDTMKVTVVRDSYIEIVSPNAKSPQVVPKDDFEKVWEIWSEYKTQKVRRYKLRDETRYSKYIISIFHLYEIISAGQVPPVK